MSAFAYAGAPLTLSLGEIASDEKPFIRYKKGEKIPPNSVWLDFVPENRKATILFSQKDGDWEGGVMIKLRLYTEIANGEPLNIVITPAGAGTPEGYGLSYWHHQLRADWAGWKTVTLILGSDLRPVNKEGFRLPDKFPKIEQLQFFNFGWEIERGSTSGNLWALDTLEILP